LLDYLRNESFHCSVLCHDELEIRYDRDPANVASYCVALIDRPAGADFAVPAGQAVRLKFPQGEIAVRPALGKAAMKLLVDHHPAAVDFDELCGWACESTGLTKDEQQVTSLASTILAAFGAGLLRLYLHPPDFCREVGLRPRATALNRWWAAEDRMLTNALHENVVLEPWPCRVLSRLDGSLDRSELLDAVRPETEQILGRPATAEDVESALDLLRRRLLLVG
jgi:hypothetical protein